GRNVSIRMYDESWQITFGQSLRRQLCVCQILCMIRLIRAHATQYRKRFPTIGKTGLALAHRLMQVPVRIAKQESVSCHLASLRAFNGFGIPRVAAELKGKRQGNSSNYVHCLP
ncbi:MAG: hypothetical protein B7Z55_10225, partial [Planctomycetales bacterium 12-60-4]